MAGLSRASLIHDAECGAALAILNSSESPDDCPEYHPSMSFLALAWLDELQRTRYLNARLQVPRSKTWVHHVLPELDDLRFRAWVRMDRRTFAFVHDLIVKHSIFGSSAKSPQAPVADQLAIALHKFGTNGTGSAIRLAAGHWGQSEGHIINCTRRVSIAITDILKDWIKWPGVEERVKESRNAMERSGIKGVIGKVDATDIVLNERPGGQMRGEDFFNRKKRYALNLTAVCDHKLRFTYVMTGWPGSVHDSRVWANADIAVHPEQYFSNDEYLLGDSAYPNSNHLVTPYKKPLSRARDNRRFNKHLSSVRIDIEHAFGLLKGRWGSLKGLRARILNDDHMEGVCRWIMACCVLHNILLSVDDIWLAEDGYDVLEAELELNEPEDVDRNEPAGGDGRRREVQRAMLERLGY